MIIKGATRPTALAPLGPPQSHPSRRRAAYDGGVEAVTAFGCASQLSSMIGTDHGLAAFGWRLSGFRVGRNRAVISMEVRQRYSRTNFRDLGWPAGLGVVAAGRAGVG